MTEDEMVGWHHQLDGCQFEQAPGVGEGQGSLVCCSPWGDKVRLNRILLSLLLGICCPSCPCFQVASFNPPYVYTFISSRLCESPTPGTVSTFAWHWITFST